MQLQGEDVALLVAAGADVAAVAGSLAPLCKMLVTRDDCFCLPVHCSTACRDRPQSQHAASHASIYCGCCVLCRHYRDGCRNFCKIDLQLRRHPR